MSTSGLIRESCYNADSDFIGLGEGLKFPFAHKLPGDGGATGPRMDHPMVTRVRSLLQPQECLLMVPQDSVTEMAHGLRSEGVFATASCLSTSPL